MADLKDKGGVDKALEIDQTKVYENSLTFDDKVIRKIAGMAASEIPGIIAMSGNFMSGITDKFRGAEDPTKGITVEVGKRQVAIDMKVISEYGRNIPEIFQAIVDKVTEALKHMTGLVVVEVNVHVYDVLTKDEFDRQSKAKFDDKDSNTAQPQDARRLD